MATGSSSDLPISTASDGGSDVGGARGSRSASGVDVDANSKSEITSGSSRPSEPVVVVRVPSFRETEAAPAPSQQRALKAAGATVVPVPDAEPGECMVLDVRLDDKHEQGEGGESSESQCRICHLGSDLETPEGSELVPLGCDCKGELGMAHRHCAEYWFRVKGDRVCEICGGYAKNITGTEYTSFMGTWNEGRVHHFTYHRRNEESRRWRNQQLCKFVLTFVIVAFVLQWVIRANVN